MVKAQRSAEPVVVDVLGPGLDVGLDPAGDPQPGPGHPVPSPGPGLPVPPAPGLVPPEPGPVPPSRPVPESELTPEQRRIRELEDILARERGRKDPELELVVPAVPGDPENIVIHILENGFTALGKVWYQGQELEFEPDGQAYRDTCDRTGWSWLELRGDEFAQVERWGKVMFRVGPWPGKTLLDVAGVPFQSLKPLKDGGAPPAALSVEELSAAASAEARRGRAAPVLPAH